MSENNFYRKTCELISEYNRITGFYPRRIVMGTNVIKTFRNANICIIKYFCIENGTTLSLPVVMVNELNENDIFARG